MESEEIWDHIIRVHQYAKELLLIAEEIDSQFRTFLQPVQEQKHALEHIIRARAAEKGLLEGFSTDYVKDNLTKALGHEYRAFFDVADWLSIRIRERIAKVISPFSNECISNVIPEYYTSIKPELARLDKDIAAIRSKKDVSRGNQVISTVEEYQGTLNKLLDHLFHIEKISPSLQECRLKESRANPRRNLLLTLLTIAGACIGAILTYLLCNK